MKIQIARSLRTFIKKVRLSPRGFTLLEIMMVVAIIGLVASIGAPIYVKAQRAARQSKLQRRDCISTLRQIDGAKEQWAIDKKKSSGSAVVDSEVNEYIRGAAPKCSAGGVYTYGAVDTAPTCTIVDHVL